MARRNLERVVWTEGMLMCPQHLQQQDLFLEATLGARLAAASPYTWGVVAMGIDEGELKSGSLKLTEFAGVLAGGLAIEYAPGEAGGPPVRPVGDFFPTTAPMLEVYQLVIDLDQRTRWLSAVERLDRPPTTERIGMRHTCIFHGLTVEWVAVKSDIGDDEITYVEEGRILEKDLPARASFILQRLGERRTFLQFHAKWLSSPQPPREMTNAVLADYKQGLETIKMLCEKA